MIYKYAKYPKYPYIVELDYWKFDEVFETTAWWKPLQGWMLLNNYGSGGDKSNSVNWFVEHLSSRRGQSTDFGLFLKTLDEAKKIDSIFGTRVGDRQYHNFMRYLEKNVDQKKWVVL